jgi:prolyl oligopeptidase
MPVIDPRPTLAAPDDDPYLWLEEVDGAQTLAWVEAQNRATLARFGDGRFAADRDVLAAIYERPDNIPLIARRGSRVFNLWKDATHPRGLWRTTTLDGFRRETLTDTGRCGARC